MSVLNGKTDPYEVSAVLGLYREHFSLLNHQFIEPCLKALDVYFERTGIVTLLLLYLINVCLSVLLMRFCNSYLKL